MVLFLYNFEQLHFLYYRILSVNTALRKKLMQSTAAKNIKIASLLFRESLLTLKRKPPTSILAAPQIVFNIGEDKPFPGGLAKGVGNGSPEIPWIKCGIAFVKKMPAKKHAM
jgi:hypothetical protein